MASKSVASASAAVAKPAATRSPKLAARPSRTSVAARAASQPKVESFAAVAASASAAVLAMPQVAGAAEVFTIAQGEPLIVTVGWAALAASFSMSLAFVVWGRSGL